MVIASLESKNMELELQINKLEGNQARTLLNKRLINMLVQSTRPIKSERLHENLNIDVSDTDAMSSLQKNFDLLIDSGLVTMNKHG